MIDKNTISTLDTNQVAANGVAETEAPADPATDTEEATSWKARYSLKNFVGRVIVRTLLTLGWVVLAIETWGRGHPEWKIPTILLGVGLAVAWIALLVRIVQARLGHSYQLTSRGLFVSTGLFHRRRDQLELLRVKDVFERQGLVDRWLSIGTVVVVPSEAELPTFYLAGADDPKRVMDLVWRCARAEREGKTVQVENL
jgi:membrane protein YdbS with pleckstrin-like domain